MFFCFFFNEWRRHTLSQKIKLFALRSDPDQHWTSALAASATPVCEMKRVLKAKPTSAGLWLSKHEKSRTAPAWEQQRGVTQTHRDNLGATGRRDQGPPRTAMLMQRNVLLFLGETIKTRPEEAWMVLNVTNYLKGFRVVISPPWRLTSCM